MGKMITVFIHVSIIAGSPPHVWGEQSFGVLSRKFFGGITADSAVRADDDVTLPVRSGMLFVVQFSLMLVASGYWCCRSLYRTRSPLSSTRNGSTEDGPIVRRDSWKWRACLPQIRRMEVNFQCWWAGVRNWLKLSEGWEIEATKLWS